MNRKKQIEMIINAWKISRGIDLTDKAWDKQYYPRYAKSSGELLDFMGSVGDAIDCMEYLMKGFKKNGLSFTMETIVKRAEDYKYRILEKQAKEN